MSSEIIKCPHCDCKVSLRDVEKEEGFCPECGQPLLVSNILDDYDGDDEDEDIDSTDYDDEDEDDFDEFDDEDDDYDDYDDEDDDDGYDYLEGVTAIPTKRLALRGCPDNDTVWLGHEPQTTEITAYEYEEGNGVTWVLVEYWKEGQCYRGYTGLKRMTVCGDIPWADHLNESVQANYKTTILAAPNPKGAYRGQLKRGENVTLLEYDGDYAFIEFYDSSDGRYNRGYVPVDAVE